MYIKVQNKSRNIF